MMQRCAACAGLGICPDCNGRGKIDTGLYKNVKIDCAACEKSGRCPSCGGTGKVEKHIPHDTLLGALSEQYAEVMRMERITEERVHALRRQGIDPTAYRYEWLREQHRVWVDPHNRLVGKAHRQITAESSLWDILMEARERRDAVLGYLRALERMSK
ncbi:MAG: hypothetical protein AB1665_00730 [Candidatus Thermoplasmatota archaeon]